MNDEEWINTRQDSTARRKTVQVPVSLIERIASELEVDSRIRSAGDLRAFLSQPTGDARD